MVNNICPLSTRYFTFSIHSTRLRALPYKQERVCMYVCMGDASKWVKLSLKF